MGTIRGRLWFFSDRDHNLKELIKCYKEICAASRAHDESLDVSVPDVMCFQSSVSSQLPRIDMSEVLSPESVAVRKLKGTRSRFGASTSTD